MTLGWTETQVQRRIVARQLQMILIGDRSSGVLVQESGVVVAMVEGGKGRDTITMVWEDCLVAVQSEFRAEDSWLIAPRGMECIFLESFAAKYHLSMRLLLMTRNREVDGLGEREQTWSLCGANDDRCGGMSCMRVGGSVVIGGHGLKRVDWFL